MKNKKISQLTEFVPYIALALLIILVVEQANPYTTLPSRDIGSYLYFGRLILRGGLPYINAWDSKPPGIYYINALGLFLGRGTSWGVWLLEFVFLYGAAIIGYRLLRKIWRPGSAVFGMIVWIWGLDVLIAKGDVVEEYSLLFNMAILSFFWLGNRNQKARIYDLLIGVMTVLSFLFRANNIGVGTAVGICWVIVGFGQRNFRLMLKRLGTMLSGVLLALACAAVLLWRQGILIETWDAAILYNFSYIHGRTNILSGIVPGFQYLGLVAWMALLGYGAAFFFAIKGLRSKTIEPLLVLLVVIWPVEIALTSLSGRGYMHYFINWLPAMALLAAYAYEVLGPVVFTQKMVSFVDTEKIPLAVAALVAVLINFGRVVDYAKTARVLLFDRSQGVEIINPVSEYIRHNTKPSDTVLDWVQSGINYMSERDSPTPYLWYPEYLPSLITPALENGFYNDLTSKPPEIIVDAYQVAPDDILSLDKGIRFAQLKVGKGIVVGKAQNVDSVFDFFQKNYKVESVIDGYTVYRLVKR